MNTLYVIRGLPGSGKTTLAKKLGTYFEADMFFMNIETGEYEFDPAKIGEAHSWCQSQVKAHVTNGLDVVVSNTFTQRWEIQPYADMAKEVGARLVVLTVESGLSVDELAARNVHGVPKEAIQRMKDRWEPWE